MHENNFARGIAIFVPNWYTQMSYHTCRVTQTNHLIIKPHLICKGPYFPLQDSYTA